jgi:DNA-binding XRE family transcriptional regulator
MKANVLLATQERDLWHRVQQALAAVCNTHVSASSGAMYATLVKKPFDVVLVDANLPHLDSLEFVHALRHAPGQNLFVVTWGRLDPVVYWTEPKTWDSVVVPRSIRSAVEILRGRLDPAAARTLRDVRYQPKEDTFFVAFRNGKTYELSRKVIEADDGSAFIGEPRVIHGGEAFEIRQKSGNVYQVAWDFVLYHQEPTYPYHKRRAEQQRTEATRARRIADRIRRARETRRWTQADLARQTDIEPPNIHRLEGGKHVPSLETLERVAQALGVRVADLLAV